MTFARTEEGSGPDRALEVEAHGDAEALPPRSGLILAALCGAQTLLALTVTIVLVGGSAIRASVGMSDGDVHWLVTSYALTFGGLVLLAGRIGDAFGHRRVFVIGVVGFGLASLFVSLSQTPAQIIGARAIQGVAAATVSPSALALLTITFVGAGQRRMAFSAWSLAGSMGGVLGYLGGGAMVDGVGWRWAFAINVPLAFAGGAVAWTLMPRAQAVYERHRFDIAGAGLITGAAAAMVYGFGQAQSHGWLAPATLLTCGSSVALTMLFLSVEKRVERPLIPLHLLRRREFTANVATLMTSATVGGSLLVASVFLQEERGYSARGSGLTTLPVPFGVALGAYLTPRLMRRRPWSSGVGLSAIGQTLMACSYALAALRLPSHSYYDSFLPAWTMLGIGISMSAIPLIGFATSNVAESDRGIVSGMFNMSQQLGTALGVAALWTITHSSNSTDADGNPVNPLRSAQFGFAAGAIITASTAIFTATVARADASKLAQ